MKILLPFLCVVVLIASARAQHDEDGPRRIVGNDALMLARSCVSERGWRHDTNDCAVIAQVVRTRMAQHDESFAQALRRLAPRLHGDAWLASRVWLQDLDEDGHRPRGWRNARWDRRSGCEDQPHIGRCRVARREDWLLTLEHSRAILRGDVPEQCSSPPLAWGSARDIRLRLARRIRERAAAGLPPDGMRFQQIDCGTMVNLAGCYVLPGESCPIDRTTPDDGG